MSEDRLEKDMENAVRDFDRLVSCLEEIIDPETRAQLARTIIFVVQRIEEEYPDLIDSNFLYNKGDCYIELGQHEAARDVLQQAQKLDPDDPTILNNLGLAYIELGQHEAARDVYQQAQKLDPDDPTILNNLGFAYIGSGQHEAARDVLQQAQKLDPNDPTILSDLGHAYLELGQHADAKGAFKRACALDKSVPHPHLGLARVAAKMGENEGTIKEYLKAAHDRATRENVSGNTLMSLWAHLNKISASPEAAQETLLQWSGRPAVNQSTAQTGQPSAPAA